MHSDEIAQRFQEMHKAEYGTEISKEDAYAYGIQLLTLLKIVYKPIPNTQVPQHPIH